MWVSRRGSIRPPLLPGAPSRPEGHRSAGRVDRYEIDSAAQAEEGLARVRALAETGASYAAAFVGAQSPSGRMAEALETLARADPDLFLVCCAPPLRELTPRSAAEGRLLFLKRPFEANEVRQLVATLSRKWHAAWQARARVTELSAFRVRQAKELEVVQARLAEETHQRRRSEDSVAATEQRFAESESRLRHLAFHDALTGLPNRALLLDRLADRLARHLRAGDTVAVDERALGESALARVLGYLPRMPISALRIDRSFVNAMGADPTARSIVEIVVTLAHAMSMHVVAEGVETKEQLEELRALGCDYAQGFFLARPMDAAQVARLFVAGPIRSAEPATHPAA